MSTDSPPAADGVDDGPTVAGAGGSLSMEEEALVRLDDAAATLHAEGRYLEALECMERALILRHRMLGGKAPQVLAGCKAAGQLCNVLAMTYLQKEDYAMVTELLKKAEVLTEHDPVGRAVTYNNFACFSRQQGRLHAALSYLQRALRIEERLDRVETPADTHLNLCAVLSQLGRHAEALEQAQAALRLLQHELLHPDAHSESTLTDKPDRIAVLAICYHNIGAECEFLKHPAAAVQAYGKGVEVATVYLGSHHGITQTLVHSHAAAQSSLQAATGGTRGSGGSAGTKREGAVAHRATRSVSPRPRPATTTHAHNPAAATTHRGRDAAAAGKVGTGAVGGTHTKPAPGGAGGKSTR